MVTAVALISRDRPDFATLPIGLDSASLYLCLSVCLSLSLSLSVFFKDLYSIDKNKNSVLMSRLRKLSKVLFESWPIKAMKRHRSEFPFGKRIN